MEKDCCAGSYLRGAFLGGGYIADPRGDFHFELSTSSQALAEGLVELMVRFGIKSRYTRRHNTYNVYIKGAESILTFLALTRAQNAVLKMEDQRALKSLRNDTNRRVNAEIANAVKASQAAQEQIQRIRLLVEKRGIEAVP